MLRIPVGVRSPCPHTRTPLLPVFPQAPSPPSTTHISLPDSSLSSSSPLSFLTPPTHLIRPSPSYLPQSSYLSSLSLSLPYLPFSKSLFPAFLDHHISSLSISLPYLPFPTFPSFPYNSRVLPFLPISFPSLPTFSYLSQFPPLFPLSIVSHYILFS